MKNKFPSLSGHYLHLMFTAYVPDPTTDLDWFKRVLKGMAVATKTDKLAWYPWGIPPIEALKKSLKSSDNREVCVS